MRSVLARSRLLTLVLAALVAAAGAGCSSRGAPAAIVGVPEGTSTSTTGPVVLTPREASQDPPDDVFVEGGATERVRAEPRGGGLVPPHGAPPGPALPFRTDQPVPAHLVFILVAGSDARPHEDLTQTRADSIHLLAVNPQTREGTVLGIPRDSWVEIPGRGRGKINDALARGGPDLLAATVRRLTGLPVDYYVLTGFPGFTKMVDELGGVDVLVERRMNDRWSGARFERGWHRMNGAQALAFSRNRNDVANGDFSRSENQGLVILSALAKMRAEIADDGDLARWIGVMLRYVRLDMPRDHLPILGALARRLDPARLRNVVAPGRLGTAGRASVVYLTKAAAALFADLRADAVVGEPTPPPPEPVVATTTSSTSTSPSTAGAQEPSTTSTSRPATDTTTTTTAPSGSSTTTTTRADLPFFSGGDDEEGGGYAPGDDGGDAGDGDGSGGGSGPDP